VYLGDWHVMPWLEWGGGQDGRKFGDQTSIKKARVVWYVDLVVSFLSTFSMKCYLDRGSIKTVKKCSTMIYKFYRV